MNIIKVNLYGIDDYRVYQRDKDDRANIGIKLLIEGLEAGAVKIVIFKEELEGMTIFKDYVITLKGMDINFQLEEIPVGYYNIDFIIFNNKKEKMWERQICHIAVGDIYLLAGQSNMYGCGSMKNLETPSKYVHCFYYGDTWGIAREPLCAINEAVDPVYWSVEDEKERKLLAYRERYTRKGGAGLALTFGKEMYKYNKVPVGIVICAMGGTSREQWSPEKGHLGGASLYGALLRRIEAVGGKVRAFLWYQGETEASNHSTAMLLKDRLEELILAIRKDLKNDELPVAYVQLSRYLGECPDWNLVQKIQLEFESELPNIAMISSIDADMSDSIHIDVLSQRKLGRRMSIVIRKLCFKDDSVEIGPRFKEASFENKERTVLNIEFDKVNGALKHNSNVRGISIWKDGKQILIASIKTNRKRKCSVKLQMVEPVPEAAELWYGKGENPCCNLEDKKGMAVPVFGPIII